MNLSMDSGTILPCIVRYTKLRWHVGFLEPRNAWGFSSNKAGGALLFAIPQLFVPAGNVGCAASGGEKP